MKSKLTMTMLVIALTAALLVGATQAWFTDSADVPEAEFTAGTLEINADGPEYFAMEGRFIDNVNPGDCVTVCWEIENVGTKKAEVRVNLEDLWENLRGEDGEEQRVAFFYPKADSGWEMYENEAGELWLYYTNGPLAGTYGTEDEVGETVKLCLVVAFAGEDMDNRYQGASYKINGIAEAVQATNGAPEAVFGEGFTAVKAEGYVGSDKVQAFFNAVKDTKCYKGEEEEPEELVVNALIVAEGSGFVSGTGIYKEGDAVRLEATADEGFQFVRWDDLPEGIEPDGLTVNFTMPGHSVTVKAIFEEIEPVELKYESFKYVINGVSKSPGHHSNYTKVKGYIEGLKYNDGTLVSGSVTFTVHLFDDGDNLRVSQDFTKNFVNGGFSFNDENIKLQINGYKTNNADHVIIEITDAAGEKI